MNKLIDSRYKYFAFISYKREDERWAKWLQHKLEHYRLPSNLNGRTDLPKEIRPVFKDTSELTPGNLPEQINEALEQSKYLIVICSPRSAQSEWVNKEVETFKSMGKTGNIIPFIIDGRPYSSDHAEECFPQAILSLPREQEILGANINEMGRDSAAVKVVARMFDIRFDELWHRHEREQKRRKAIVIASVTCFILFLMGVAFWMYIQKNETQRANWKMMENQARMIAEKSKTEVSTGNAYDAILALLEIIPEGDERPFVIETEQALRFAYCTLLSNKWNYRLIGSNYDQTYFSDNEEYIICLARGSDQDVVDIYNSRSLQLVSQIISPGSEKWEWDWPSCIFPSNDSDTIFVTSDKNGVICYDITTGKMVGMKPWTTELLKRCMTYNINNFNEVNYSWFWKEEIMRIIGLSEHEAIHAHSPVAHLILYEQHDEDQADSSDRISYVLYDYESLSVIKRFDNQGRFYSMDDYNTINTASFSSDSKYLAMAFGNGKGIVVDLSDFSERRFDCGNIDCCHYSNWLTFGRNNDLLHSSMFEEAVKRYNCKNLEPIDSIVGHDKSFNYFVNIDMCSDGSMCLIKDYASSFVYYYAKANKTNIIKENLEPFGSSYTEYSHFTDTIVDGRYKVEFLENCVEFSDLKGEVNAWSIKDPKIGYGLYGFINDNRYMLLAKYGFRGSFVGIDVIDLLSGTLVDQTESVVIDTQTGHVFFDKMKYSPDGDILDEYEEFFSFEELISLCRKATSGMKLSEAARRKFFLN